MNLVADPGFFFRGANLIKKVKRASVYFFLIENPYDLVCFYFFFKIFGRGVAPPKKIDPPLIKMIPNWKKIPKTFFVFLTCKIKSLASMFEIIREVFKFWSNSRSLKMSTKCELAIL